jgi:hypothetical protein
LKRQATSSRAEKMASVALLLVWRCCDLHSFRSPAAAAVAALHAVHVKVAAAVAQTIAPAAVAAAHLVSAAVARAAHAVATAHASARISIADG